MMRAKYKINDILTIEVEAEKLKDLLQEISLVDNALSQEECGKCKSTNTFPRIRVVDNNSFPQIQCDDCKAFLPLGTSKDTQILYKKRFDIDDKGRAKKDASGKAIYLPDNGWRKYNPKTKQIE